jgi:predicted nucleic acid-binding protein
MAWLVDTNILSELRRPKPEPKVVAFIVESPENLLYVSTVTLAELRFGMETAKSQNDRQLLSHWLTHTIRPMFHDRILGVTEDIILQWRMMVFEGRKIGRTFSQPDLFLAATAIHHGLTLVTRNIKDFTHTAAKVLNPWD